MAALAVARRPRPSGSGNSLRALIQFLDNMTNDQITQLNIPTGTPLVYELDDNLKPKTHYYLGNADEIEQATQAVANQSLCHSNK